MGLIHESVKSAKVERSQRVAEHARMQEAYERIGEMVPRLGVDIEKYILANGGSAGSEDDRVSYLTFVKNLPVAEVEDADVKATLYVSRDLDRREVELPRHIGQRILGILKTTHEKTPGKIVGFGVTLNDANTNSGISETAWHITYGRSEEALERIQQVEEMFEAVKASRASE